MGRITGEVSRDTRTGKEGWEVGPGRRRGRYGAAACAGEREEGAWNGSGRCVGARGAAGGPCRGGKDEWAAWSGGACQAGSVGADGTAAPATANAADAKA